MSELLLIGDPENVWATIHLLRQRIEALEAKVKELDRLEHQGLAYLRRTDSLE